MLGDNTCGGASCCGRSGSSVLEVWFQGHSAVYIVLHKYSWPYVYAIPICDGRLECHTCLGGSVWAQILASGVKRLTCIHFPAGTFIILADDYRGLAVCRQATASVVLQNRQLPFPSTFLRIHYSSIILTFSAIYSKVLKVSVNKS
jgi:hypothetical protein